MTPDQLTQLKAFTRESEGWIPYLYLDSRGNATAGCGHLVANWVASLRLPFAPTITAPEFARLKAAPANMRAEFYAPLTRGRLTDAQIDALLDADIAAVQSQLAVRFANAASWPAPAGAAITDMGFNLGVAGLISEFPLLCVAIRAGVWAECARQCRRAGIGDARNAATAALFLAAAGAA